MNDKVPNNSIKLMRGGTAYSPSSFELKLQLHGQVSNPYSFSIKQNYKSSATTKASVPPYTEKSWTTPGTYTWTVPSGVTRIRVAVCGGGGGGAKYTNRNDVYGGNGGISSIKNENNIIQATGDQGGNSEEIENENGTFNYSGYGGKGGTPNGRSGSYQSMNGSCAGGNGFAKSFTLANGSYGKGGNGDSSWSGGGGSGGYNSQYINLSNSNLNITVGLGGIRGGSAQNGTSGFVLIAYGEGIE